ncbi:DNA polymerase III subunit alpha [Helicobacter sp. MIT 14-3879]|uniref:DNA polymerase III subunit alpha n=1 Tax=Helicobacter sp. MIT 14-3879 TaxID=2040649 RepID=UPI000E1F97C4|nr:DNA polymerase III subunit alpha [Helicobacter sp. MIT 14-3879]RDU65587.1 DNA polymerase III subunit alpha [Helicobacter sp. MIT 14-3879]
MSNFTHLHLHTEYSLLDGANQITKLAKQLKEFGMNAVAVTDHGNMFGALDFYITMLKEGIKPILGIETYIHNDDELGSKNPLRYHLCLYAKNEEGYKNLMLLSSKAYLEGFYKNPRINKNILKEHSKGIICSSACLQGEVNYHLNTIGKKNQDAKGFEYAKKVALEYQDIFKDDFYLEIMRHGIAEQKFIDESIINLSLQNNIKLIATNDTHYTTRKHAFSQEVVMCISMGKILQDNNRLKHSVEEFYVKSQAEMQKLFADIPEVLQNTQEIVDKCNLIIDLKSVEIKNPSGEIIIPYSQPTPPSFKFTKDYALEEGLEFIDDESYFFYKCKQGLENRLKYIPKDKHKTYYDRLDYEMKVIAKMQFCGYMLIVWDFVREARKEKIPVGPGRGSAAGSLVAFCLGITDIDPIKHTLLFERFLNPERVTMPDIDMDFCQEKREKIIEYVSNKYGKNNVAHVVTFNSMSAKSVIRDVSRVFGIEYKKADEFAKLIPNKLKISLKTGEQIDKEKMGAFELEPKISEAISKDSKLKEVWDMSLILENQKRNLGTHAAAIVIDSNEELWNKIPLCVVGDKVATQYSMDYLEKVNLIKFDFLGLKTLSVIQKTLDLIGKEIDFNAINLDDEQVYKEIQNGDTIGMFQIESSGMRALNKRLKTSCFDDLVAVLALFRPGPMESGMIDDFIDRKHGIKKIEYAFDELAPILSNTYGVIVYQEQVMQIVQVIGGFSLGESDLIRRAMGKKDVKIMAQNKAKFLDGAVSKGFDRQKCDDLWELIVKFAGYGFNKSHSAAYAMIAFQTAYLKTYYKHEFMAALLSSEKNNVDNINKYIEECKSMGIKVLPPHINISEEDFSVIEANGEKKIVFGFSAIKGIGDGPIQSILKIRGNDKFNTLEEFLGKIDYKLINKKVIESLAKSGSLKGLGYSLKSIVENIDYLVDILRSNSKSIDLMNSADSLFKDIEDTNNLIKLNMPNLDEYSKNELLDFEYEMLGIFMSGNPLDEYASEIKKIKGVVYSYQIQQLRHNSRLLIIGIIKDIKQRISKKGSRFADILVVDKVGNIWLQVFEKDLDTIENISKDMPICIQCQASDRDDTISLRLEKIIPLDSANQCKITPIFKEKDEKNTKNIQEEVVINDYLLEIPCNISYLQLKEIQNLAITYSGNERLVFEIKEENNIYKLYSSLRINNIFKEKIKELKIA